MPQPVAPRLVRRARRAASTAGSRLVDPLRHDVPVSAIGAHAEVVAPMLVGSVPVDPAPPAGDAGQEVAIYLNSIEIIRVPLVELPGDPTRRQFRFKVKPLLRYARKTDRLSVRHRGAAIPFADGRAFHRPVAHGDLPTSELRRRLAAGETFASDGTLQKPKHLDLAWQRGVLDLYARVRDAVHAIAGHDVFLIYGSLLGAVRDGGFIGHDTDLDAGYISNHAVGPDAGRELAQIGLGLVERGFHVECRVVTLHIYDEHADGDVHIDLFHTFFGADGVLRFPWGVAGEAPYRRTDWTGAIEIDFAGSRALAPSAPERMVAAMYGSGWRTPDPGFTWARERRAREGNGRVPKKLNTAVNWADFHARAELGSVSPFVEWCLAERLPPVVIDLGCGDGRDSIAFAATGRTVVGIDAAETAVRRAAARPGAERVRFRTLDLDDAQALRAEIAAARQAGGPVLFYGCHLLESLSADTAAQLLEVIAAAATDADMVAFGSRTTVTGKHTLRPRREIDGSDLERYLTEHSFTVVQSERRDEARPDPFHRVLARRDVADGAEG